MVTLITFKDSLPVVKALSTRDTVGPGVCGNVSGLDRMVRGYGDVLHMAHGTLITLVSSNTFEKHLIKIFSQYDSF